MRSWRALRWEPLREHLALQPGAERSRRTLYQKSGVPSSLGMRAFHDLVPKFLVFRRCKLHTLRTLPLLNVLLCASHADYIVRAMRWNVIMSPVRLWCCFLHSHIVSNFVFWLVWSTPYICQPFQKAVHDPTPLRTNRGFYNRRYIVLLHHFWTSRWQKRQAAPNTSTYVYRYIHKKREKESKRTREERKVL